MAKFNLNDLPKQARIQLIGEFYDAFNSLKDRKEIRLFLRDLLTPDEIAMFHRRIQVALLLKEGYHFEEITQRLKVGKNKITKVKSSLDRHGEGYDLVIERLKKIQEKRQEEIIRKHKRSTIAGPSLRRYPGFSIFLELIDEIKENKLRRMK